jgi:hypothetical protein
MVEKIKKLFYCVGFFLCLEIPLLSADEIREGKYEITSTDRRISYLSLNNPVKRDNYEAAFFGTDKYISNDSRYPNTRTLEIVKNSDSTYFIKSNWGFESYLFVNGVVSSNSYQWAYFGTDSFLHGKDEKYCRKFKIVKNDDNTYFIKSTSSVESYLAVNGIVPEDCYQWAFFGTDSYIKENDKYFKHITLTYKGS